MCPDIIPEKEPPARPQNLLCLPLNERGRDWFVGDLHGEARLVEQFLEKVGFDQAKDRLIAAGDLVDRGPQSELLLHMFGANPSWFFSVLGNHDAMFREAVVYHDFDAGRAWGHNGSSWFDKVKADDRWWLCQAILRMPLAIEVPLSDGRRAGVVHAEIPLNRTWGDIPKLFVRGEEAADMGSIDGSALIWGRSRVAKALAVRADPKAAIAPPALRSKALALLEPVDGVDLLVMGHTRLLPKVPLACSNMLWIDTGGGYTGGCLSFVDPVAREYVQLSHEKPTFRRGKLKRPLSLAPWKLTPELKKQAELELRAEEKRSREVLAMFGLALPEPPPDTGGEKDSAT